MGATYTPKRTYFVDKFFDETHTNILLRGNEPLNEDLTFAYEAMSKRISKLGITGSDGSPMSIDLKDFNLITVSIIDNTGEGNLLFAEFKAYNTPAPESPSLWPPYLKKGPEYVKTLNGTTVADSSGTTHPGNLIWYPVQGCGAPNSGAASCENIEPVQYGFCDLIDFIHSLLTLTKGKNIIYYHCVNGHDRTGSVSAAYLMKYMNVSYTDATTLRPPQGAKAFSHPWNPPYKCLIDYYYKERILK